MIWRALEFGTRLGAFLMVVGIGIVLLNHTFGVDHSIRLGAGIAMIGTAIEFASLLPIACHDIFCYSITPKDGDA